MIRKLHNNLSGLNTKADPNLELAVVLTEQVLNLARREHFPSSHSVLLFYDGRRASHTSAVGKLRAGVAGQFLLHASCFRRSTPDRHPFINAALAQTRRRTYFDT